MPSLLRPDKSGATVIICDTGTGFVKCGFAGESIPASVFPNVVGQQVVRYGNKSEEQLKDVVVGAECAQQCMGLEVSYPVDNGIVKDWKAMQKVWDHAFRDVLKIDPTAEGSKIMLTTPPLNPSANRHKLMEVMFEQYGFSALNIQVQAVLTLYAQGLMTGLVLDCGDGVSHAVPVVDGYALPHLTKQMNVAGRHITSHLMELLQRRGYALSRSADQEVVRRLKEQACFVALDFAAEAQLARETTHLVQSYTLPDGRTIRVAGERLIAPEALFTPGLIGREGDGISEMAYKCIQENASDNRRRLYEHIVLSGGCTMLPGLPQRLEADLRGLYLAGVLQGRREGLKTWKLRVEAPPQRKHMVYLGAAVLADIMRDDCGSFWITRQEWAEDPQRALQKSGGLLGNVT